MISSKQNSLELAIITRFCEDAKLNERYSPWRKRRYFGADYAYFLIASKGHSFPAPWKTWWEDYIGIIFLGQIIYEYRRDDKKVISDVYPVRLMNTVMNNGRSIPGRALILI